MFAVIETGGKQYRVGLNDVIRVEKLPGKAGDKISLEKVLLLGAGVNAKAGKPYLANTAVTAEIVEQARADKVRIFKKRRRKGYRRTRGHRQHLTVLRITAIAGTQAEKPKAAAKPEAKNAPAKKAAPAKSRAAAKKPAPTKAKATAKEKK